jgi:DNA (cytosine-5)-methyltransferase 1
LIDRSNRWEASPLFKAGRAGATLERAKRAVAALGEGKDFLIVYYGSDRVGGWQSLDRPLRTLTTLDRFGLVQWRDGQPTLRMLQVPELKAAMGLPVTFALDHGTRRDKVKLLGNGVAAPVMQAVVSSLVSEAVSAQAA